MSTKVAVYGTLRKGFGNHVLLRDSKSLGTSILVGAKMFSLGGFPAIVLDDSNSTVVVELYDVDDAVLRRLDQLEGFPGWYDRREVNIEGHGKANVYCMEKTQIGNRKVVESGDWVKQYG